MLAIKAGPKKGRMRRKKPRRLLPSRTSVAVAAVLADIESEGPPGRFLWLIRLLTLSNSVERFCRNNNEVELREAWVKTQALSFLRTILSPRTEEDVPLLLA